MRNCSKFGGALWELWLEASVVEKMLKVGDVIKMTPVIIDREFEVYEFFSFLKFNEFYEFFSVRIFFG